MINRVVAERLIENLTGTKPINHQQGHWLGGSNLGGDVFVVSEDDKWGCATSACAAGHIFIDEADPGMAFNASTQRVYANLEDANKKVNGVKIDKWAGEKLGITDFDQQQFLFFQFNGTKDTVNRIKYLLRFPDPLDLDLYDENVNY